MFKATTSLGNPVTKDPLSDFRKFLFVIWKQNSRLNERQCLHERCGREAGPFKHILKGYYDAKR